MTILLSFGGCGAAAAEGVAPAVVQLAAVAAACWL